ncbi:MAG TPA: ATP-binding protein [Methanoregulaceae archaeon]|nr:ATP-binding protein [Methanoregulaceae archaeon]
MSQEDETLKLLEVALTAEIFNQHQNLDINDLTPECRILFGVDGNGEVKRPLSVSEGMIKRSLGIQDACSKLSKIPVITCDDFGQRIHVTSLDAAVRWFVRKGGINLAGRNPALAYYLGSLDTTAPSYPIVRAANPPYEDTRLFLDKKIATILSEDESLKSGMDLVIISAPDEVEQTFENFVCTDGQKRIISKIKTAREHRETLQRHGIHEVGKLLFVGPPGTGKTSLALGLSREMHLPLIEVRLSMVTSQYLGETSKNIDRIFDFAKRLAPCILFIDEFDFVAKSRVTDDHGAMKRAVNSLLKNIDRISLIRNGVLLIGATNHPQLLDEAAWRRFDEIVEFSLPEREMRAQIIRNITGSIDCQCDYGTVADNTEGFSGADLRIMIKEALLSALIEGRSHITDCDIEQGIILVSNRGAVRRQNWL